MYYQSHGFLGIMDYGWETLGENAALGSPIMSGNFTSSSEVKPTSDTSPGTTFSQHGAVFGGDGLFI